MDGLSSLGGATSLDRSLRAGFDAAVFDPIGDPQRVLYTPVASAAVAVTVSGANHLLPGKVPSLCFLAISIISSKLSAMLESS